MGACPQGTSVPQLQGNLGQGPHQPPDKAPSPRLLHSPYTPQRPSLKITTSPTGSSNPDLTEPRGLRLFLILALPGSQVHHWAGGPQFPCLDNQGRIKMIPRLASAVNVP